MVIVGELWDWGPIALTPDLVVLEDGFKADIPHDG